MESKKFLQKHPSAWLPIAFSLVALALMAVSFAMFGIPQHKADEEAAAHLFQIWLVLELFTVGYFAIKWLPQKPKQALQILVVQIVAVLAVCAPVFYFNL